METKEINWQHHREVLGIALDHLRSIYESNQEIVSCGWYVRKSGDVSLSVEVVKPWRVKEKESYETTPL